MKVIDIFLLPMILPLRQALPSRVRRWTALLVAVLAVAFLAVPVSAELVILEDGRFLKASGYEVRGERIRVELLEGGALTFSLARVDRIIDDEIEPPPPEPPQGTAAVVAAGLPAWEFTDDAPVPSTPYGDQIYAVARTHGVNPDLVAALVRHESAFNPGAVSHKGAGGLMQLMPATARRFGLTERQRFEPERNLEAGTRYLRWLLDRFDGDVTRALAAYNAGEGAVDRYDGVPPYRETRNYIRRIFTTLGITETTLASLL